MAFYDFLTKRLATKKKKTKERKGKVVSVAEMVKELGLAREATIGSYEAEENPDDLGPSTYIDMQHNDGEVQAIVRILTLPIVSADIHILPDENDKGERDFIEAVFTKPSYLGGMTTSLSFIIADMTRAIFEGFRLYEKVARIIDKGPYKGKIGWRKLAPRDASTVDLRADRTGGFMGAHQEVTFGSRTVSTNIPTEKCMLFTFQKEKHWLYGESILKAAHYHYDKKHKLYYISHKKAEIDATGLKVLKIGQNITAAQRAKAEGVVDTIGVNTRISLPPGVELEVVRGGEKGMDIMPLIDHHNTAMAKSALTQVLTQTKYAYPYGSKPTPSTFLLLAIKSIMRQMEETLNNFAVAPLIDYNFGTQAYPKIRFAEVTDESQAFLKEVFNTVMKTQQELPDGFIEEVVNRVAKALKLKWAYPKTHEKKKVPKRKKEKVEEQKEENVEAVKAFERGKIEKANSLKVPAPRTLDSIKGKLLKTKTDIDSIKRCFNLGQEFVEMLWQEQ